MKLYGKMVAIIVAFALICTNFTSVAFATHEVFGAVAVYETTQGGQQEGWEFTVMHTNDTHGYLAQLTKDQSGKTVYDQTKANIAKRAMAVSQIRAQAPNNLLLDAGDVFSGSLYFTKYNGLADVEFMNMLGYDAMNLGNHEFDKGPQTLADFIQQAQFPIVNANFDFTNETALSGMANTIVGEADLNGKIYPAVILDVNGEKVGVIGLNTEDTANISSPGDNIVINEAFAAAANAVTMLENKGINKIIALTHLGWDRDLQLAREVEGIDIIVGGHSHTTPDPYPAVVSANESDNTPTMVVQAVEHGNYLGRLNVTFDDNGVIISSDGGLLDINSYAEDPAVAAKLTEKTDELKVFMETVVGSTAVALDGVRANVRTKETNLGNLIADSMLDKVSSAGATIAITNGGGIRASIDKGDITLGEVLTVMPFGNTLALVELTGEQIVAALEHGVGGIPAQEGRFPHVAGLKFVYDPAQAAGSRVISVEVNTETGYQPINHQANYLVATIGFLAGGGDGYAMFKAASKNENLYFVDFEVFIEYLAKQGKVNPQVEGRIKTGTAAVEFPAKNDVGPTKSWTIVFNQPVKRSDIHDKNILITGPDQVSYVLDVSTDGRTVTLTPSQAYHPGATYCLYLKNIHSENGNLARPVYMQFTISK